MKISDRDLDAEARFWLASQRNYSDTAATSLAILLRIVRDAAKREAKQEMKEAYGID